MAAANWPLLWGTNFACIALYATALLVTAAMLRRLRLARAKSLAEHSVAFARGRGDAVLALSLACFGIAICAVLGGAIVARVITRVALLIIFDLFMVGAAWVVTPMAMRAISSDSLREPDPEQRLMAGTFAGVAVAASLLLSYAFSRLEPIWVADGSRYGQHGQLLIEVVLSLVVALPYAVLFVTLTLMVDWRRADWHRGAGGAGPASPTSLDS